MTPADLIVVSIRRLPLGVWNRGRRWFEELLREFAVIASDTDDTIPRDLLAFLETTRERFGQFSEGTNEALETAHAAGEAEIDLELNLPQEAAPAAAELSDLIERARQFCRRGELLTLEPEPDVVEFMQWYLDEVIVQIEGNPPTPWPESRSGAA